RFDLPQIGRWGSLALPESHRVMELRQCISRVRVGEAGKALGDLAAQRGSDAVHLTEKLVGARIRRRKVCGLAKRFDRGLVLPARVLRDSEADVKPRRFR